MRIETDYNILMYFILGLAIVLALIKINIPREPYKIVLALMVAVTMPSFFPGHGRIMMFIPNGAMFAIPSTEAKALGVIFTIINGAVVD